MTCSFDPTKLDKDIGPLKCPLCDNWIAAGEEHPKYFNRDAEIELVTRMNEFWGTNYQRPEDITRDDLLYYLHQMFFEHDLTIEYFLEKLENKYIQS